MGAEKTTREILEEVRGKRGYLLTHHEFFGFADPAMLEKYDQVYQHLTLKEKFLEDRVKEFVWLGILAAVYEEAGGPIHIKRAKEAGLTDREIAEVFLLTQVAQGFDVVSFTRDKWGRLIPGVDLLEAYGLFIDQMAARSGIPARTIELILIGVYAALAKGRALRFHLGRANEHGLKDEEIYEAISYILLPCGAPTLIQAAEVLKEALARGELKPSSAFKNWLAAMS